MEVTGLAHAEEGASGVPDVRTGSCTLRCWLTKLAESHLSFLVAMPLRINLPPLTRGILLGLLLLSLLNASFSVRSLIRVQAVPALAIIPARSLKYPWTMLTAALVETNLVSFAISAITLFYGGRYLERAWTSQEFAKFVLFVTMIPNLLTFAVYCLWYTVTGSQIRA